MIKFQSLANLVFVNDGPQQILLVLEDIMSRSPAFIVDTYN